jgi:hypothetical protein
METLEKIKIAEDTESKERIKININELIKKCNSLIRIFNKYQPFVKINSREDAESLLLGPAGYYDKVVLANIQLAQKTGLEINIQKVCELYGIDRSGYMSELGITDCPGCSGPKVKGKVNPFIEYSSKAKFLSFEDGQFAPDSEAIEAGLDKYNVYCPPEQVYLYRHYELLFDLLQKSLALNLIGSTQIIQICKALGNPFVYNYDTLKIYKNDLIIAGLISKIQ